MSYTPGQSFRESTSTTETRGTLTLKSVTFYQGMNDKGHTYLTISDEAHGTLVSGRGVKTPKAVEKAVADALVVAARKDASKAAAKARHAAKDAAKGVVRDECQICEGAWVIEDGITSLHGYSRPGCGWLVGSCRGAKQLPYSKSCALLVDYRAGVEAYRAASAKEAATLRSGRVDSITIQVRCENFYNLAKRDRKYESKTLTEKDGAEFTKQVEIAAAKAESDVRHAEAELKRVDARIAAWVLR